jgi:hypothetical protein
MYSKLKINSESEHVNIYIFQKFDPRWYKLVEYRSDMLLLLNRTKFISLY